MLSHSTQHKPKQGKAHAEQRKAQPARHRHNNDQETGIKFGAQPPKFTNSKSIAEDEKTPANEASGKNSAAANGKDSESHRQVTY